MKPLGLRDVPLAMVQILSVLCLLALGVIATLFPMGFIVAYTAVPTTNQYGESAQAHDQKYIDQGSSGWWEYWASPLRIAKWFNNVEDGTLREPSGKGSAACGGKERTFWNQYLWLCRNPFNGKRNLDLFRCMVNECLVEFIGDEVVSDKVPPRPGSFFVRATHKTTGKRYYNYRKVWVWPRLEFNEELTAFVLKWLKFDLTRVTAWMTNRVFQIKAGYKIQPSHRLKPEDPDDADKAFTVGFQPYSKAN